jgi:predicted nucleic acid-binding protein
MRTTLPSSSAIVIDANLAVWGVLPVLSQISPVEHLAAWRRAAVRLCAPSLWAPEAVSAVRSAVYTRLITEEEGWEALDDLFALRIELLPTDMPRCRSAMEWARRLNQRRAYDAFYVALADELGAELWTADRRLANAAQQAGATWVRWIGEAAAAG